MNYVKGQFVCLPHMPKFSPALKYTDTLVYVALRSFNNETNGCYPAFETIAARAGCNRLFVINSIKRLEVAGLITVKRSNKIKVVNRYTFASEYMFEQIPYQIFDPIDLTLYEKSMLLCLRRYFIHGKLTCLYSFRQLSSHLGLTYKVVHKNILSLISKGYIVKIDGRWKTKWRLTEKIDWPWDYSNIHAVHVAYPKLLVG